MQTPDFLTHRPGRSRLILSLPHTGTDLPDDIAADFVSPWQARADTDWWLHHLYDFAEAQDITIIRTTISRSVIDVNRDPSGASLYPGMATTGLCPLTDFDGNLLYHPGAEPTEAEITRRRTTYYEPYHTLLAAEIARLRTTHPHIILFDAHSIRSTIPRLFAGELPVCNIGTNDGTSATPTLTAAFAALCAGSEFSHIVNGRFKGGTITRHYGNPAHGIHAIQLELACRAYIDEPAPITPANWPTRYDPARAAPIRALLQTLITLCLTHNITEPSDVPPSR